MRSFIISVMILFILIAAIIINGLYINSLTENMIKSVASLPEDFDNYSENLNKIELLSKKWDANHKIVSISVGGRYVYNVKKALSDMLCYYETKSYSDYIEAKRLLLYDLRELHNLESFSLHSIF